MKRSCVLEVCPQHRVTFSFFTLEFSNTLDLESQRKMIRQRRYEENDKVLRRKLDKHVEDIKLKYEQTDRLYDTEKKSIINVIELLLSY